MTTQTKAETSLTQAYAQLESISEMVDELKTAERSAVDDATIEDAMRAMYVKALSVQVRSGWVDLGTEMEAEEYEILLCWGGPAVRIVGRLDEGGVPQSATLEHQDWGTPWTTAYLRDSGIPNAESVMLTFARQFYFGG